jgi:hypothetical protein
MIKLVCLILHNYRGAAILIRNNSAAAKAKSFA